MADIEAAKKALSRAKIRFMGMPDTAFWTSICFAMRHEFDSSVETAQTDGQTIWYNPDFFMKYSQDEQLFILVHEVSHIAFDHMARMNGREGVRWNKAADHAINLLWKSRGLHIPSMALADPAYIGMSSEEIYEKLPPEPQGNGNQNVGPTGAPADSHLAQPQMTAQQHQQHITEVLLNASIQSKTNNDAPGTIPGDIAIELERLLNPKLPSKVLLQRFFNKVSRGGRNWSRPNRRYHDIYLPQRKSKSLGHIAVAVDASGSVSDEEFHRIISEVGGIFKDCFPEKISLITFDTSIRQVDEVRSMKELLGIQFHGRGGTEISGVLEWAKTNSPQVLMTFTDGWFNFPTDVPVSSRTSYLWMIHDNSQWTAPMGNVVHYKMED